MNIVICPHWWITLTDELDQGSLKLCYVSYRSQPKPCLMCLLWFDCNTSCVFNVASLYLEENYNVSKNISNKFEGRLCVTKSSFLGNMWVLLLLSHVVQKKRMGRRSSGFFNVYHVFYKIMWLNKHEMSFIPNKHEL